MPDKLQSDEVPQANRIERVVEQLLALRDRRLTPHPRDAQYYKQAARVLGLLSPDDALTANGYALTDATEAERGQLLIQAFAASTVGGRWVAFAGVARLADVSPDTAEAFLLACSELSESTARRRASTLRYWWQALFPPVRDAALPAAAEIAGLPVSAYALFEQLLREPAQPPAALLAQVEQYVAAFERAARTNEFIDWQEAKYLGNGLKALHDRLADDDRVAQQLWQAAARYFLVVEDSDRDFDIGGLDDDLSVFHAVACHLGHKDLVT